MKKFKNFFKKNLKFIIILIVAIIITSMVSVYAAYSYLSTDVSYTKADGTTVSVADALNELYKNKSSSSTGTTTSSIEVSTKINCVGSYADVDRDGKVDGIIFADLAFGKSGQWGGNDSGKYSYSAVTSGLKTYNISQLYNDSIWGTHAVISPASGTNGTDRFYIMTLTDYESTGCYWYKSASGKMSDYSSYTSTAFGKGKENTTKMITKWNASGYGTQDAGDLWGKVQTASNANWFIPSSGEWGAIASNLGITSSNYSSTYKLKNDYWSSSQYGTLSAWGTLFSNGHMTNYSVDRTTYVRLAATF